MTEQKHENNASIHCKYRFCFAPGQSNWQMYRFEAPAQPEFGSIRDRVSIFVREKIFFNNITKKVAIFTFPLARHYLPLGTGTAPPPGRSPRLSSAPRGTRLRGRQGCRRSRQRRTRRAAVWVNESCGNANSIYTNIYNSFCNKKVFYLLVTPIKTAARNGVSVLYPGPDLRVVQGHDG